MPHSRILSCTKGGLGIETNIVTTCTNLIPSKGHYKYGSESKEQHDAIFKIIKKYMQSIYGKDWGIDG